MKSPPKSNKTLKTSEEFVVGKHNVGWLSSSFLDRVKDATFEKGVVPQFRKLERNMYDHEIKSEFKPEDCTLGDIIAFMDDAPEECKDGYANIFYFGGFVVDVDWRSGRREWSVYGWELVGARWNRGDRVFSRNFDTLSLGSEALTLESFDTRLKKLEKLFNPELL